MEDSDLELPELWLNVFIAGPEAGPNFYKMFARAKCFKAELPDDADLVVFSGSGHDVNPVLYGQKKHSSTFINDAIDKENLALYAFCRKRGIPMLGVCGGAQILHVANGGELYQHVDGHNGCHTMWDVREKLMIERISSVHHQMCIRNEQLLPDGDFRMEILGVSHTSKTREINEGEIKVGTHMDIEAFFYRDTCCLGFQGHPEYGGYPKYTQWCLKTIDRCINENPDLSYRANDHGSNKLRMKEELLKEQSIITTTPELIVEKVK